MKTKYVVAEPYNKIWISEFKKIKAELESSLGDLCIRFEVAVINDIIFKGKRNVNWKDDLKF